MRRFEIAPTVGKQCYIYSYDEDTGRVEYLLNDGRIVGGPGVSEAELAKYYFASREEAQTALIAAKIRGDAL